MANPRDKSIKSLFCDQIVAQLTLTKWNSLNLSTINMKLANHNALAFYDCRKTNYLVAQFFLFCRLSIGFVVNRFFDNENRVTINLQWFDVNQKWTQYVELMTNIRVCKFVCV